MAIAAPTAGARILTSDLAAFYNLIKGVSGSGESVTLIYNAAGSFILQPSSDPATGTELIQIKNNAGTVQMALSSDGKVYAADGTVALPGVTWEQEKATGFYRISSNKIGVTVNNSEKLRIDATGVSLDAGSTYLSTYADQVGRYAWDWNGRIALEVTVTGTGAVTTGTLTLPYTTLSTGATSGSTVGVRGLLNVAAAALGVNKVRLIKFSLQYGNIDANTTSYLYLTDESVTGAPSATARHIGIRQAGATINFTTADNTTEQTTDISAAFAANVANNVDITFDGVTAKCYVAGTLRATHATNVPGVSATTPVFRGYITNAAAADKVLYLGTVRAVLSV